jgi:hypothetical protein
MPPVQPPTPELKPPSKHSAPAAPIASIFEDAPPPVLATEQREPADDLEHFRKYPCGKGHKSDLKPHGYSNWDAKKIVYMGDNKRWGLFCIECSKAGDPAWYTPSASGIQMQDQRIETAPVNR